MRGVSVFGEHAGEYDRWFDENEQVYQAEIEAVRALVPPAGPGLEVGVGTGRFAAPLGAAFGIDPARGAARIANGRGVGACRAFGERLPFGAGRFAYALLITVDPFVPDVMALLREMRRVLSPGGQAIVGMIDRDSPLGQMYEAHKDADKFYREAQFNTAGEMIAWLREAGFERIEARQTITGPPGEQASTEQVQAGYAGDALVVREGYGEGAFVVLSGVKRQGRS